MAREQLIDFLSSFSGYIIPFVFISFFVGTLFLLVFANRRIARQTWLAGFIATLMVVTAVGIPLFPIVDMHKFSNPSTDEERTLHELYIVGEDGSEIRYDTRASPPVMGTRTISLASDLVHKYDDDQRIEMATFLVENADEYKSEVEDGDSSLSERLQPPRYVDDQKWDSETVSEISEFESIRVYQRDVAYSDDNTMMTTESTELVLEVNVHENIIVEEGEQ